MASLIFKQLRAFQDRKLPVTVANVRPVITAIQESGHLSPQVELELAAIAEPRKAWSAKSTPAGIRELTGFAANVERSIQGVTPEPAAPQTRMDQLKATFLPWATKAPETGGYPLAPDLLATSVKQAANALTMNHPDVKALLKKFPEEALMPSGQPKPWVELEITRARTAQIENRGDEADPFKNLRARLFARALENHVMGTWKMPPTSGRG